MRILDLAFAVLFFFFSNLPAQAAGPALTPAAKAISDANKTIDLLMVLTNGVDECFKPSRGKTNLQLQDYFQSMVSTMRGVEADINADARERIDAHIRFIQEALVAMQSPAPFPANVACGTRRSCLEKGFAGDPRFPKCLPVNGDPKATKQYRSMEQLFDVTLPRLIVEMKVLL